MFILQSGWETLTDYLSAHILTGLIPAFFIAGAVAVFISKNAVVKYLGADANKYLSYTIASISGAALAVCSCTILPLFAGIRQRGAGLGPAVAFLFSGPAINIVAIIYSARLLGFDMGLARAIGAISFSIVIGLIMSFLFRKEEAEFHKANGPIQLGDEDRTFPWQKIVTVFAMMFVFLVLASSMELVVSIVSVEDGRWSIQAESDTVYSILAGIALTVVVVLSAIWFTGKDIASWFRETWKLLKKIVPYLLLGIFLAGVIRALLTEELIQRFVGGNSLTSNVVAALTGAVMYFCTLTEVPIVRALMDLGMGRGPALTFILAGPSLSLPNMIVIGRVLGAKRTAVYITLVIILSVTVGMTFGAIRP